MEGSDRVLPIINTSDHHTQIPNRTHGELSFLNGNLRRAKRGLRPGVFNCVGLPGNRQGNKLSPTPSLSSRAHRALEATKAPRTITGRTS